MLQTGAPTTFIQEDSAPLQATLRPNALDPISQNQNVFPLEAFQFVNPNKRVSPKEDVVLEMRDGWKLNLEGINFGQFDEQTLDILNSAYVGMQENKLMIENSGGHLQIQADVIDIIARELNLEGETVTISGSKIINLNSDKIILGSGTGDANTLDGVLRIEGDDIYFGDYNGDGGMFWDQSEHAFKIKGHLVGGTINIGEGAFSVNASGQIRLNTGGALTYRDEAAPHLWEINFTGIALSTLCKVGTQYLTPFSALPWQPFQGDLGKRATRWGRANSTSHTEVAAYLEHPITRNDTLHYLIKTLCPYSGKPNGVFAMLEDADGHMTSAFLYYGSTYSYIVTSTEIYNTNSSTTWPQTYARYVYV